MDGRPLTEEERCRLETNLPQLIRLMDPAELSGKLLEVEVIGHEQYEHIRSQSTAVDMNNELVDILVRRSYAHYRQFLIALQDTGQQHVADVLINGGGQSTEAYVILHGFPTSMEFSQRGISGLREGIGIPDWQTQTVGKLISSLESAPYFSPSTSALQSFYL